MFGLLGPALGLIAGVTDASEAFESSGSEQSESWSYYYHYESDSGHSDQSFLGLADSDGNLYWPICTLYGRVTPTLDCSLRSTDRDGNLRFSVPLGSGIGALTNIKVYLVAGSAVLTELNAALSARSTSNGEVLWTHDFRDEYRSIFRQLDGVAYDGSARLVVVTGPSIFSLSVVTGETIWQHALGPTAERAYYSGPPLLDEDRNAYLGKLSCPGPTVCRSFIVSFDPYGALRFETEADTWFQPVAVAEGRLVVAHRFHARESHAANLLDTETGSNVSRFLNLWGTVVMSAGLGFFLEHEQATRFALNAFDLATGAIQWRFPLGGLVAGPLLTGQGTILLSQELTVLEISPHGELLGSTHLPHQLRPSEPPCEELRGAVIFAGRWFSQCSYTVFAYDFPGAPSEGLGWNSFYGNAQHTNQPRVK